MDPNKPALRLGTAVHARILEPHAYGDLIAVQPDVDRRTKDGKEIYAEFLAGLGNRTVIDSDQQAIVDGIAAMAWGMKSVVNVLDGCTDRELSIVAELHGTVAKARLDMYDPETGFYCDVKTTGVTVAEFGRQAFNLNYQLQLAHYRAVARAAGLHIERMGFLVCETNKPYGCQVVLMPNEAIDMAESAVEAGCKVWSACRDAGEWPAYEDKVVELQLPAWATRQMEGKVNVA
jgi:exodeoxyribonuclease VIII